jgi:hypothetical protein
VGDVDSDHAVANLLLDNFGKNYLKLRIIWLSWTTLTTPKNGQIVPVVGSREAIVLVIYVDVVRTLISAALWLCFPADENIDHPSLTDPVLWARLQEAERQQDPTKLLSFGVFTAGPSHALHHHDWANYPFQYADWRAVFGLSIPVNYPILQ